MIKFSAEDLEKLKRIENLLTEANNIVDSFSEDTVDAIDEHFGDFRYRNDIIYSLSQTKELYELREL